MGVMLLKKVMSLAHQRLAPWDGAAFARRIDKVGAHRSALPRKKFLFGQEVYLDIAITTRSHSDLLTETPDR